MKRKIYIYRAPCAARQLLAYATPQTAGACVHEVEAPDTPTAKKLAVREHRAKCEHQPYHEKK